MASNVRRSEDVGGMGESYFRLLAKDAQLVVNNSSDDQAGWDFEVEDSSPLAINYSNQSRPVYRIQVKATMGDSVSVPMSFSSLLSLIQYGGPAFVFLIKFGASLIPETIRVVHIDQKKTMEILAALRKRELSNESIKLNKSKYSLRFDTDGQLSTLSGSILRQSLERTIGKSYLNYLKEKAKWLERIEVESDLLHANILFEKEADLQAMAECMLGYETPFNISSVIYKAPLGIPDQVPVHSGIFSSTTIWPSLDKLPRGFVRLRTSSYGCVYEFKASFYSVPSSLPKKFAAARIKTAIFDIVYRYENQRLDLRVSDLFSENYCASIAELRGFIKYFGEAAENKKTFVEFAMADQKGNSKPLQLFLETSATIPDEEYEPISLVAERLFLRLSSLGMANELMRPVDVFDLQRTGFLSHVGNDYNPPFSFEFSGDIELGVLNPDAAVFNFHVKLEKKTLICFAAFYGSVHELSTKRLRGDFFRSEYLGEIIVSDGENIEEAINSYGGLLKTKLSKKGFVVI
ncbi:hypothetical protein [Pseudomonas chlororaphis]|uniref:hypothetical protein n=1 Tax=Pseudomonas chlororaphis TaxID=587753 RepID=UPI0023683F42|nr:hypothetical protein [Pseudomonas chlororaphis]WDG50325.1 hypothetical protein PUP58_11270 [Pseudomonas chlororaphis]